MPSLPGLCCFSVNKCPENWFMPDELSMACFWFQKIKKKKNKKKTRGQHFDFRSIRPASTAATFFSKARPDDVKKSRAVYREGLVRTLCGWVFKRKRNLSASGFKKKKKSYAPQYTTARGGLMIELSYCNIIVDNKVIKMQENAIRRLSSSA